MLPKTALFLTAMLCISACTGSGSGGDDLTSTNATKKLTASSALVASCSGCHSSKGKNIIDLKARASDEIKTSLQGYKSDSEGTSVMHRIARGYSEQDIEAIAAYFEGKVETTK